MKNFAFSDICIARGEEESFESWVASKSSWKKYIAQEEQAMTNKNVKRISMILAALMVAGAATGCGAKKDTKVESTNKVATNSTKLDEDAIKDTYTGIDDMYVLEGSKDVD